MHVGLNLVYLVPGETGGMETYARELIPALLDAEPGIRLTAFLSRGGADDPGARSELRTVAVSDSSRNRAQWVSAEQLLLPRLAAREGVDLLHSLGNTSPVGYRSAVS